MAHFVGKTGSMGSTDLPELLPDSQVEAVCQPFSPTPPSYAVIWTHATYWDWEKGPFIACITSGRLPHSSCPYDLGDTLDSCDISASLAPTGQITAVGPVALHERGTTFEIPRNLSLCSGHGGVLAARFLTAGVWRTTCRSCTVV